VSEPKPCVAAQRVRIPSGRVGDRRNRVLRGYRVICPAKRRQGVRSRVIEPRNVQSRVPVASVSSSAESEARQPCAKGPAGSESGAEAQEGCQGTCEALTSPVLPKTGPKALGSVPQSEGNRAGSVPTGASGWTSAVRASALPAKRGNLPEGSPQRESGRREASGA